MTENEIIDKVYAEIIEQAAKICFQELMLEDYTGTVRHENAERRFRFALTAAAVARNRIKSLKGINEP